jgi:hypothetical protein
MFALFDLYRLDLKGSAMWLGTVQSYNLAVFEIELTAARAPGDYTIVNRKTGQRTDLRLGVTADGHDNHVELSVLRAT